MYGKNERPNQMYEKEDKWLKNIPSPFNYLFRNTGCLTLSRTWKFILNFNVNENFKRLILLGEEFTNAGNVHDSYLNNNY